MKWIQSCLSSIREFQALPRSSQLMRALRVVFVLVPFIAVMSLFLATGFTTFIESHLPDSVSRWGVYAFMFGAITAHFIDGVVHGAIKLLNKRARRGEVTPQIRFHLFCWGGLLVLLTCAIWIAFVTQLKAAPSTLGAFFYCGALMTFAATVNSALFKYGEMLWSACHPPDSPDARDGAKVANAVATPAAPPPSTLRVGTLPA